MATANASRCRCRRDPHAAEPVPPAVPDVARPLPLSAVRLTGGPLKHAQDLTANICWSWSPIA